LNIGRRTAEENAMNYRDGRGRPPFACILAAVGAAALAAGCNRSPEQAQAPPATPVPVATEKPTTAVPIHLSVSEPGRVLAFEETPIYARVPGYVQEWKVNMGATVTEGQTLAVLSVPDIQAALAHKEAAIRQADAELKRARAAVMVAEKEEQRLKSQYERLAKVGTGALNADSIDEAKYGYEAAQARLKSAQADVDVKQADLEAAAKDRDVQKAWLEFATLKAPYAGVVTQRNIDRGDFVQPATQARGNPLFVVQRTDLMRVLVSVPESDADWVGDGCDAGFRVQALRGREYKEQKVARVSWSLNPRERTLTAEIDVPNPDGALRPGMYVYATITAQRIGLRTLPASAVVTRPDQTQGDKTFCFGVEGGKAVQTPVKVGARDDQRVEVLAKQPPGGGAWQPFTGDEEVAVDGSKLSDGQAVEAKPAAK
jgi:RND family efflux transporter MFP subunit